MLKALFLYSFNAIYHRVIRPVVAILIAALASLGILLLSGLIPESSAASVPLNNALTVIFYGLIIAFAILFVFCALQLLLCFYHSFFGEEGALFLSIPVTAQKKCDALLLSGMAWGFLLSLVAIVAITLGLLLPFEILMRVDNVFFLTNFFRALADSLTLFTIPRILFAIAAAVAVAHAAITLGALLFPQRRALGAILFLLVGSLIALLLHNLVSLAIAPSFEDEEGLLASVPDLFAFLLSFLFGAGTHLFTRHLLEKRLNLYH